MSTLIDTLKESGRKKTDLTFTSFWGGNKNKIMLQLTQGFGCSVLCTDPNEPGFVQLTIQDAKETIRILHKWLEVQEPENKDLKYWS